MSQPIKPPRRFGGPSRYPPTSPSKGSKQRGPTASTTHGLQRDVRPPLSPTKKSSFADIIRDRKFEWTVPSQPSRKVSIEDLINESVFSWPSGEEADKNEAALHNLPKVGSIVVRRNRNDGSSSGTNTRPSIQDIYICDKEGTFTSLRDLMDGRSFMMGVHTHESPFAPQEEGNDSQETQAQLPAPSKKISFQDIMSSRDYAILAPPTPATKKESYQDIEKRQRFELLETLIESAVKDQFDDDQSVDDIIGNFMRYSNTQYKKIRSKSKDKKRQNKSK